MFNNYDDILNISELAEALKIGSSQAYKRKRQIKHALKKHNISNKILLLLCFL